MKSWASLWRIIISLKSLPFNFLSSYHHTITFWPSLSFSLSPFSENGDPGVWVANPVNLCRRQRLCDSWCKYRLCVLWKIIFIWMSVSSIFSCMISFFYLSFFLYYLCWVLFYSKISYFTLLSCPIFNLPVFVFGRWQLKNTVMTEMVYGRWLIRCPEDPGRRPPGTTQWRSMVMQMMTRIIIMQDDGTTAIPS